MSEIDLYLQSCSSSFSPDAVVMVIGKSIDQSDRHQSKPLVLEDINVLPIPKDMNPYKAVRFYFDCHSMPFLARWSVFYPTCF